MGETNGCRPSGSGIQVVSSSGALPNPGRGRRECAGPGSAKLPGQPSLLVAHRTQMTYGVMVTVAGAVIPATSLSATQTFQPVGVIPFAGGELKSAFGNGKLAIDAGEEHVRVRVDHPRRSRARLRGSSPCRC